ncbi:MAG: alanine racemase [Treponema sp.]|nr:alanine racemase [Treponema sp.]
MSVKTDYNKLASEYGTPFYLFDYDSAINRISQIKQRLPSNAMLCYAIKANTFLVDILKNEELLFEVCSPGELSICEKVGLNPNKIVFSGVVKNLEDIKRAYNKKVHTITIESLTHCNYLIQAIESEPKHTQNVILRLSSGNQFGMSPEDLYECAEKLKLYENVKIRGIHFFSGTQKKLSKITDEITFIQNFCDDFKTKTGIDFSDIEYGPGLSYDYFSLNDESQNYTELESVSLLFKDSKYNFVIELGRYIASPCGKYVTKISDLKGDEKNHFCLIDGGINHINYYGQMMGMKNPKIEHISHNQNNDIKKYTIAGSLCTTADIVVRQIDLASPEIGDLLVFNDIGAYSITEGIYLFLSHPLPAVLLQKGNNVTLLRKAEETYIINS